MNDHDAHETFARATRDLVGHPDLVTAAVSAGRRRRRRSNAAGALLGASGVVAAAVLAAGLLGGDGAPGHARDRDLYATAAPTPSSTPAPSAADGRLASRLAAVLARHGTVSGAVDWYPWGEPTVGAGPTLADGSSGYGGKVELDGERVEVLVGPRTGATCGDRWREDGSPGRCEPLAGGWLLDLWESQRMLSFKSGDVEVTLTLPGGVRGEPVLSLGQARSVVVDDAFRGAPYT